MATWESTLTWAALSQSCKTPGLEISAPSPTSSPTGSASLQSCRSRSPASKSLSSAFWSGCPAQTIRSVWLDKSDFKGDLALQWFLALIFSKTRSWAGGEKQKVGLLWIPIAAAHGADKNTATDLMDPLLVPSVLDMLLARLLAKLWWWWGWL